MRMLDQANKGSMTWQVMPSYPALGRRQSRLDFKSRAQAQKDAQRAACREASLTSVEMLKLTATNLFHRVKRYTYMPHKTADILCRRFKRHSFSKYKGHINSRCAKSLMLPQSRLSNPAPNRKTRNPDGSPRPEPISKQDRAKLSRRSSHLGSWLRYIWASGILRKDFVKIQQWWAFVALDQEPKMRGSFAVSSVVRSGSRKIVPTCEEPYTTLRSGMSPDWLPRSPSSV